MENNLLGPKALAHVCGVLGLNTEMNFTCMMTSSSVENEVLEDDHYETRKADLPEGVLFLQLKEPGGYYEYGIVNFRTMNIKE